MISYRIETFLTLCEHMNYRKTAEILHISQPAVTQQIQHLEQEYNCKLFNYKNRKLFKTEAAVILEQHCRAIRYHDRTIRRQLLNETVHEIRVGATKTIGDYFLHDYIQNYLKEKDHSLNLVVDNTQTLLEMLEKDLLDFAVVEGMFDKSRFDHVLLQKEPFVGICHKDHPFVNREVPIEELMGETIIHREAGSGTRAILEQELSGYNESLSQFKRHICISSFKIILDLVRSGAGISFVYNILADSDPELGKFTLQSSIVREFNIVYLKHADLSKEISLFFGKEVN